MGLNISRAAPAGPSDLRRAARVIRSSSWPHDMVTEMDQLAARLDARADTDAVSAKPNDERVAEIAAEVADDTYDVGSEHEGEHCQRCGTAYSTVWSAPDDLWERFVERAPAGLLCLPCFDELARDGGIDLQWSAER